jgi:hypothetical protein
MGFFSQDCTECGHPLLSPAATLPGNAWMSDGVAISARQQEPDGRIDIHTGIYDGYGRLDDAAVVGFDATVWHRACWEVAGRPCDYRGPSPSSPDQGWFFADADHAVPEPTPRPAPLADTPHTGGAHDVSTRPSRTEKG